MKKILSVSILSLGIIGLVSLGINKVDLADLPSQHSIKAPVELADLPSQHGILKLHSFSVKA